MTEELVTIIKLELKQGHSPMYCALAHDVEVEEVEKIVKLVKQDKANEKQIVRNT